MGKIDVIYLTGGHGVRAGLGYPKQYAQLGGKPLFIHGLEIFNSIDEIENIIIPSDDKEKVFKFMADYNINNFKIIDGGETRQQSVNKGLQLVSSENVLIAEAVRPFITKSFVIKIIGLEGNVVPYTKLNSTPFDKENGYIFNRNDLVCVQTPQKYVTRDLKESHEFAIKQNFIDSTDDLYLMKCMGIKGGFTYIEGPIENIKITYPVDLKIAEAIYHFERGNINE